MAITSSKTPSAISIASVWVLLTCAQLFIGSPTVRGQGAGLGISLGVEPTGVTYPSPEYYAALQIYRSGDLETAGDAFDFAIGRTRRDANGHWIDAIPVYAMMAECQYHMGDLEGAMKSLDIALSTAIRYRSRDRNPGWLYRPIWEELMRTEVAYSPKQFLWSEANKVSRLPLSLAVKYRSGEQLTEQRLAQGGVIEELNIKTVDVVEVMRGIAIASYRRRIILGPLANQDPLADQLLDATKYPAGLQFPVARTLIGAMRTAERFGSFEDQRCVTDAVSYGTFQGRAHPLSPVTELCAASALAGSDKPADAIPVCLGIANRAARLEQYEWIGEAMQLGAGCADEKQAPVIQQAAQVAAASLIRESRLAALHCLIAAADAAVTAGDVASAAARLNEARTLSARRDVVQPRLETYGAYVAARLAARTGAPVGAAASASASAFPWSEPMNQIMAFATNNRMRRRSLISMPRLYQLQRIRLALGRDQLGQSADALMKLYSDDPTIDVWRRDPVDAIIGTIADRDVLRLHRLRTAATRESALDVLLRIEDLQSGRLRSLQPIGGRVTQVRALARLPDALLDTKVVGFRNKAAKPIRDLRAAAEQPAPGDLALAAELLNKMENQAWSIALDRHDLPLALPKQFDAKKPLAELPDGVALLAFCQDGPTLNVVLCTKQRSSYWPIRGVSRIGAEIAKLMRAMGASPSRGGRLPKDNAWREMAASLRQRLIKDDTGDLLAGPLDGVKQLVIIPDGLLWYLPFEMLPVGDPDSELFGDAVSISYAATPALALHATAAPNSHTEIALTTGRFFAPREDEANEAMVQSIMDSVDDGAMIRLPEQASIAASHSGMICGNLLLAETTTPNANVINETRLTAYEAAAQAGQLGSWLAFPSEKPTTVMLAGFRSNLDTPQPVSGHEIFQTIGLLQFAGVRDVVLSRWAVGGESTAILMSEFAQELPFLGVGKAFARAKSVLRRSELSPAGEPTMVGSDQERDTLSGDEPFFWSTYLHAGPIQ